jgi:hypothetical protein
MAQNNMNIESGNKVYNIITKERISVGRVRNRSNPRQDPLSTKIKNFTCSSGRFFFRKEIRKR